MIHDSNDEPVSGLRAVLKYSWIAVAIAALAVVGIFYVRWQTNHDINQRAADKAAADARAQAERAFELTGGNKFEVLNFYAAPGIVHRGDSFTLCYGVSNATSVEVDPKPTSGVWPSLDRCFDVTPEKTTTYTLTAKDSAGHVKTASFTVKVLPR